MSDQERQSFHSKIGGRFRSQVNRGLIARVVPVFLAALVPTLGLLDYSISSMLDAANRRREANGVRNEVLLVRQLAGLVHDLQFERALSAVFAVTNGTEYSSELRNRRELVDEGLLGVASLDERQTAILAPLGTDHLRLLLQTGDSVALLRSEVNRYSASATEGFSRILERFLVAFDRIGAHIEEPELIHRVDALSKTLWLKEFVGRERALIAPAIVDRQMNDEARAVHRSYIRFQDENEEGFRFFADDASVHFFDLGVSDSRENFLALRNSVLEQRFADLSANEWFRTSAEYTNSLRAVEIYLSTDLGDVTTEIVASYREAFINAVLATFLVLALTGGVLVVVGRQIRDEIRTAEKLRSDVSARNALHQVSEMAASASTCDELLYGAVHVLTEMDFLGSGTEGAGFSTNAAGLLQLRVSKDFPQQLQIGCATVSPGHCLCGRAAATGKIQFASHVDRRHETRYKGMKPHGHYNIPLKVGGRVKAVVVLYLSSGARESEQHKMFLNTAAQTLSGALDRIEQGEELARSKDRLGWALESTADGVWDWDIKTGKVLFSDQWARTLGYDPPEIRGHIDTWKELVHPDDWDRTHAMLEDHFAGKTTSYECENRLRKKDGTYRHNLDRGKVVAWSETGDALRMVGSDSDITERKEAEIRLQGYVKNLEDTQAKLDLQAQDLREQSELLQAALADAQIATKAKGDFLATMSHEIRTPMNGVLGMTQLLLETDLTEEQKDFAETIMSSGNSLLTIINDILDFSKIEAGKLDVEPIPFDFQSAISELLTLLAPKCEEKNLEIMMRFKPGVPRNVVGDPGRLRQVLMNLIGNAIKFTKEGHVLVEIDGEEIAGIAHYKVSVKDTGIGISKEGRGRLFQAFSQADGSTTRKYGGTGLGLAISRQLIEIMGGEMNVDSEEGVGSTFWFTLPLPVSEAPSPMIMADVTGMRVLIVDDNEVNRRVVSEQIQSWGMESEGAESAAGALDVLSSSEKPFDVAILDYRMPDVNGEKLGLHLKSDPGTAGLKLVLMTSAGSRGDGKRLEEAGFAGYLVKPADPDTLRAVLGAVCGSDDRRFVTRHSVAESTIVFEDLPPETVPGTVRPRPTVLLVEDNAINQKVAIKMLSKLGCDVELAENGEVAVRKWNDGDFDVIFMDCQMPEVDGYEATGRIRSQETSCGGERIPIIAMTANAMAGDREKCMVAGMDDYVTKPVSPARIAAALEQWIEGFGAATT